MGDDQNSPITIVGMICVQPPYKAGHPVAQLPQTLATGGARPFALKAPLPHSAATP
jgi:hypothetical protein